MEMYFNLFKVRFNTLLDLMRKNSDINIRSDDTVHIYINLEPILIKLCNPEVIQHITVSKNAKIEFIANVINLAAHYRLFFTKYKIDSKVFLYMPSFDSEYKNTIYNKDYRMYFRYKFSEASGNLLLYKLIEDVIPFIHLITEYIQGVYFIESKNVENSLIPYMINEELEADTKNIIVTGDLYDLQYVNHDCSVIIPKGDKSFICTENNVMKYLASIYQCRGTYNLTSNFIPFILSIIGSKYRNIYSIKGLGMKTVYKTLQKAVDEKMISSSIDNIHLLLNVIKQSMRKDILQNYYCIDFAHQYKQLTKKDKYDIMTQLKDKFDNIALKQINDKYFIEYPIMLQEITANPNKRTPIKF